MRHLAVRIGALAVAAVTLACWEGPTAARGPTPVVSLTLVEGESLQVASVTFASPADSTFPPEPVPVPAELVSLRLEDDSGNTWPLTFTGALGKFSAAMSPRRGERYRLKGSVLERTIAADTRVPAVFALLAPAGDTVTVADAVPCQHPALFGEVCVRVVVAFDGPGFVSCQVQDQDPTFIQYCYFSRGTSAELRILPADRIREVLLWASNGDAQAWLYSPNIRANVAGALGGFGAVLTLRRKLYIP